MTCKKAHLYDGQEINLRTTHSFPSCLYQKKGVNPNLPEKSKVAQDPISTRAKIGRRPSTLPFQSGEGRRRRRRRKQFLPTTSNNTSSHASPPPPPSFHLRRGGSRPPPPIAVARNWRSPVSSPLYFDGLLTCANARASVCNLTTNRYVRMRKQIATEICCRDLGSS